MEPRKECVRGGPATSASASFGRAVSHPAGRGVSNRAAMIIGATLTNSMYDLDQVEVLSGPQGTLFGKNATAGVINIVTRAPVIGRYEAIGHADIGNHDYVHGYVIANLPLGEQAALRVSFHHDS